MSIESTASNLLQRGVELDMKKRYTEALVCYQEGIQVLVDIMKNETGNKKVYFRSKIEEYMKRAELIKQTVKQLKEEGKYHEQINIEDNSTGHSYHSTMGAFLTEDVENIKIEDPYIRSYHQCQNFVRFCELCIKNCKNIGNIELVTTKENDTANQQRNCFSELRKDLQKHKVNLDVFYSETLHDRQVTLSSGWIIKIGRGLDYFKAPYSKFALGMYDLDFRPCHETTIDIFHSDSVKPR